MASPIPKAANQRQRRNRTTSAATLEAAPAAKVALPVRYSAWQCVSCYLLPGKHTGDHFDKEEIAPHDFEGAVVEWNPLTRGWWDVIWASPMAGEWVAGDVPGLLALAMLWDQFYRTGDPKIHAECRMASREFGLSPLSRRQLQWEIKRVEGSQPSTPAGPKRGSKVVLSALDGGRRTA